MNKNQCGGLHAVNNISKGRPESLTCVRRTSKNLQADRAFSPLKHIQGERLYTLFTFSSYSWWNPSIPSVNWELEARDIFSGLFTPG